MSRLLLFLKKISFVLLFIILEIAAFRVFMNGNIYHKAKIMTISNYFIGGFYEQVNSVGEYFGLRRENDRLIAEIARLNNELQSVSRTDSLGNIIIDSASTIRQYEYIGAKVRQNSINKRENYIIINKGTADGIAQDMALIAPEGIVGYVIDCSDHFAVAMSILNTNFRTSGKIKGDDFVGSIYWDGLNYEEVVLSELPKYSQFKVGDTVMTTDYSYIFPPDQMIGTIVSSELINATFYDVRVKLSVDMSRIRQLLAVKYEYKEELKALENKTIPNNPE